MTYMLTPTHEKEPLLMPNKGSWLVNGQEVEVDSIEVDGWPVSADTSVCPAPWTSITISGRFSVPSLDISLNGQYMLSRLKPMPKFMNVSKQELKAMNRDVDIILRRRK